MALKRTCHHRSNRTGKARCHPLCGHTRIEASSAISHRSGRKATSKGYAQIPGPQSCHRAPGERHQRIRFPTLRPTREGAERPSISCHKTFPKQMEALRTYPCFRSRTGTPNLHPGSSRKARSQTHMHRDSITETAYGGRHMTTIWEGRRNGDQHRDRLHH